MVMLQIVTNFHSISTVYPPPFQGCLQNSQCLQRTRFFTRERAHIYSEIVLPRSPIRREIRREDPFSTILCTEISKASIAEGVNRADCLQAQSRIFHLLQIKRGFLSDEKVESSLDPWRYVVFPSEMDTLQASFQGHLVFECLAGLVLNLWKASIG